LERGRQLLRATGNERRRDRHAGAAQRSRGDDLVAAGGRDRVRVQHHRTCRVQRARQAERQFRAGLEDVEVVLAGGRAQVGEALGGIDRLDVCPPLVQERDHLRHERTDALGRMSSEDEADPHPDTRPNRRAAM
jgi:hypothetical protein